MHPSIRFNGTCTGGYLVAIRNQRVATYNCLKMGLELLCSLLGLPYLLAGRVWPAPRNGGFGGPRHSYWVVLVTWLWWPRKREWTWGQYLLGSTGWHRLSPSRYTRPASLCGTVWAASRHGLRSARR